MKKLLTKEFWLTNLWGNKVSKGINITVGVLVAVGVVL